MKYHHERWDGSGYPEGLKGDAIPLLARIVAVADVLDALSSERTYRHALSIGEAVGMLQQQAGQSLDPDIVDAAARLHQRGELTLPIDPLQTRI